MRRECAKLVERQRERRADVAVDGERPVVADERDVVVDQQVVEADRRHRPAQHLERHAVVARGELQLLARDALDAHVGIVARADGWRNGTSGSQPSASTGTSSAGVIKAALVGAELAGP